MAATSIGNRAARGAMWNVGASVGSRVVGLIGTLYMTRLLSPDVIGEVSAAAVLSQTANWMSHWGFNQYMVTKAQGSSERTYHVAVINTVFALIGIALIAFTGSLFAPLLSAPNLAAYLPGLALSVLIRRLTGVADKVLVRDLRFREVAIANAVGELVFTVSAVTMAATTKLGGQAIVIANILQALVAAVLVLRATGFAWFQRAPWSWARAKEIVQYGFPLGVAQVLSNASRYWDNLAFSAFFGRRVLGLYNMAYNLADIPAVQFGEQIAGVLLPAMQNVSEENRKRAVVRASALLGLIVFPMAIGLGAIAQSLIELLLRPEWQGVAPLLTVLCALSVFRPLTWVFGSYLAAYGRNRTLMALEALKLVLLIGCIAAFAKFGPLWSAGAVGLAFATHALVMSALVVRTDGISGRELASGFIRPLVACVVMAAAVIAVRHGLHTRGITHKLVVLLVEIVVGAIVYVPLALLLARETSEELVGRVRKALRRGEE
ncbi:MAG: oligosaccharide flippase family protein [Polyangiales bacterium]